MLKNDLKQRGIRNAAKLVALPEATVIEIGSAIGMRGPERKRLLQLRRNILARQNSVGKQEAKPWVPSAVPKKGGNSVADAKVCVVFLACPINCC